MANSITFKYLDPSLNKQGFFGVKMIFPDCAMAYRIKDDKPEWMEVLVEDLQSRQFIREFALTPDLHSKLLTEAKDKTLVPDISSRVLSYFYWSFATGEDLLPKLSYKFIQTTPSIKLTPVKESLPAN